MSCPRLPFHRFGILPALLIAWVMVSGVILAASAAKGAWIPVGDASAPDGAGYVQITPPLNNQVGAVWLDSPLDLTTDFDLSLLVNLGDRDGNGADGLSIVFQDDPRGTAAIGGTGGGGEWIGMFDIRPAVAIEVDTYQNGGRGDPACDHLGINEFLNAASVPDHAGAGPVCPPGSPNLEDGADHVVRLVYDASAPLLTVHFDGQPTLTYARNLGAVLGGTNTAWFGVVGSTGGAFNDQQFKAVIPASDLIVTKTVSPGAVVPGAPVTYTVAIQNINTATAFLDEVEDLLPAGFAYVGGSATGLTTADPAVVGRILTWTDSWLVAPGTTATLTFRATSSLTSGTYFNEATLRGTNFADAATGPTAPVVVGSNLTTSTLAVVDPNGGDLEPGDVLEYTLTLLETAGLDATGVSVLDVLPPDVSGPTVTSVLPPGAVDNTIPGRLDLANLTVPAGGGLVVVFEVVVLAGTVDGTTIDNTATVTNGTGTGAAPLAPTLLVVNSSAPASGSKPLYLYDNLDLSRVVSAGGQADIRLGGGSSATWTLNPDATLPLTIDGSAGTIPVTLWIRGGNQRVVSFTVSTSAGVVGTLGPLNLNRSFWGSAPVTFDVPVTNAGNLVGVSSVELTVDNLSNRNNRWIRVQPNRNGLPSRIDLEALTVIRVESVEFFDAPYPGGSVVASTAAGGTVYVRSVVSDPFGSFDITAADLTLTTPSGAVEVNAAAMTEVAADANGPYKTFELPYPAAPASWPAPVETGTWTARVTAFEGTEGLVSHTRQGTLQVVGPPDIMLVMSVQSYSDPVNGTANPFSLPGASMTYTVTAANHGGPGVTPNSVIITNPIPPNTSLVVADLGSPSGPVAFAENSPPSGLTFDPATDLSFSTDGGGTFPLTVADLVPDGTGADPRVTHVRVNPQGSFAGVGGAGTPGFTLLFRVNVQ